MTKQMKLKNMLPVAALAVAALFLVSACGSEQQQKKWDAFAAAYDAAMEDGVITTAEATDLKTLGEDWLKEAGNIDWAVELGQIAGTILASVFGVNWLRNRSLPGTVRVKPPPVA